MWKYPRWIEFREALPKTATGKIQRYRLRGEGAGGLTYRGADPGESQSRPACDSDVARNIPC